MTSNQRYWSIGRKAMTCSQAQSYIMPFIKEELDINNLKEFLQHIKQCENCKEELEVYFTLLNGMKQLDENKIITNNFRIDFEGFLHKQEDKIIHDKNKKIQKRIILVLFMILLGIWIA